MEKLYELHQEGRYDLLVLDTPPTRNALDFLDAPERLSASSTRARCSFFTAPGRLGLKVLGRGTGVVFSVLKRVTGIDLLAGPVRVLPRFGDMADGFRERAERVNELLGRQPHRVPARHLAAARRDRRGDVLPPPPADAGLPFAGVVVNRMQQRGRPGEPARSSPSCSARTWPARSRTTTWATRRLAERDRANLDLLRRRLGRKPMIEVPDLEDDVHDLDGLRRMDEYLFESGGTPSCLGQRGPVATSRPLTPGAE